MKYKPTIQIFLYKNKLINITKTVRAVTIITALLLLALTALIVFNKPTVNKARVKLIPQEVKMLIIKENNEFSKAELISLLKSTKCKFPHIAYAQAYLESGNFKSAIFKENNNMFGMKKPSSRATLVSGVHRNHAVYDSWRDCVLDYLLYQSSYLKHVNTEEEYLQYLSSYAENPNYVARIRRMSNKFKKLFKK